MFSSIRCDGSYQLEFAVVCSLFAPFFPHTIAANDELFLLVDEMGQEEKYDGTLFIA